MLSIAWFWLYLALALLFGNGTLLGGIGAALIIHGLVALDLLSLSPPGRILSYLGSRSYSIFLMQALVGRNVARLLLHLEGVTKTFLVLNAYFALATIATLGAAEILFRLVERPTHRAAQRIELRWSGRRGVSVAGLLGAMHGTGSSELGSIMERSEGQRSAW